MNPIISITDLVARVKDKEVISDLTLEIIPGQVVAISGKNGSGKSSLAMTLLGSEQYEVKSGKISFMGEDLLKMSIDERARSGLYVAWQNPVAIPGVSVFTLCKAMCEAREIKIKSLVAFKEELEQLAERVGLTKQHIGRSVNDGFSGGERKRLELLQILLIKPRLVVLDEVDSGLDVQGRELILSVIDELRKDEAGVLVISHYEQLLKQIKVDTAWEMVNGRLYAWVS